MSYMRDADGVRLDEISVASGITDAQAAADGAVTAAAGAQSTADGAVTDAATAQAAADAAQADADTAQSTANAAGAAAGNAQTTADNAATAAGTAQTSANAAQSTATAAGNAATAAQGTANAAGSAAATAQSTANAAAAAAAAAQADVDGHEADHANPHVVTAAQVGLGNVSNTSDATKQVANDKRYLRSPGPAVIGVIGASISSNGALSFYDRTLSGCVSYGSLNPIAFGLPKTKGRFTLGGTAATVGFTTAQMIATHLPNVLLSNWDYCVIGEVTNDLGNGVLIATTRANITTMIDALLGAGILPILTTVPPNDTYVSGAGLTWITQYNEWVKRQARELGVPLIDYHAAWVNPSTNAWIAGFSSDGTHPSANGANAGGQVFADTLNGIPGPIRQPLEPSYNPNLMIPDVCANSVGADKIVGSGNTTGGWAYNPMTSTKWKGNAPTFVRGTTGNYTIAYPVTAGAMVAGHRCRLSFGIDILGINIGTGTWSAYLYNDTQSQVVAGYSAVTHVDSDGTSTYQTDAATSIGVPLITCATSKPFKQSMIGSSVAVQSGVTARFAAGTTITAVAADGSTATTSTNALATASANVLLVTGTPQVSSFEFDVQPDMVGDTFTFYVIAAGGAGTALSISQVTLADLTALGAA